MIYYKYKCGCVVSAEHADKPNKMDAMDFYEYTTERVCKQHAACCMEGDVTSTRVGATDSGAVEVDFRK